jgi:hypothetical protein
MKKRYGFILVMFLSLLFSCEEDVEVIGNYDSKPIVYCLLNPDDSIHYLRVSRSFVIRNNPGDHSINPDSLLLKDEFYAYLEENSNDRLGEIRYFEPSLLNSRDSGLFPIDGLLVFSVNCRLKPEATYNLYINFPDLPKILNGSTSMINPVEILDPSPFPGRETTILPGQGYILRWASSAKYSVYQVSLNLNYFEGDSIYHTTNSLELSWPLLFVNDESPIISQYINPASFYKKILDKLTPPPAGSMRKMIAFDVRVFAGGEELSLASKFNDDYYHSFFGLNDFSNIDGAIGVFSSFSSSGSYNNRFSDFTIDYLATSDSTGHLGFLKHDEDY